MPKSRARKIREVWCIYERAWVPMGRSRSRCPLCGAEVGDAHKLRESQYEIGTIDRMKELANA